MPQQDNIVFLFCAFQVYLNFSKLALIYQRACRGQCVRLCLGQRQTCLQRSRIALGRVIAILSAKIW